MIFEYLLLVFTTMSCALATVKIMQPVAIQIGLVDKPNIRKEHSGSVPLIGGISIFVAVLIATSIWMPNTQEVRMYLIASAMIVFIGVLDDKHDLSVRVRIVGQLLVASLMIFGVGTYISDFGDLFSQGNINIGKFGFLFSYLAILVTINAFNMIDGMDGLLGMLALNTLTGIAILFFLSNNYIDINFPLIIAIAVLPYLTFNLGLFSSKMEKIYMGDAGSMFIGLSIVWLLAKGTQGVNASFNPVIALWITAIPLMDMMAIIIRRVKKGNSPFKADNDHIHHICLKYGMSQSKTLFVITGFALLLSSIGIIGHIIGFSDFVMLGVFLVIFALYNKLLGFLSSKVNT